MTAAERARANLKLLRDLEALRVENPRGYLSAMDFLDALLATQGLEGAEKESAVLSWIAASQPRNLASIARSYAKVAA